MINIKSKLKEQLYEIHIQQRLNSGEILTENEIVELFQILKNKDIEVKPLLEIIEKCILNNDIKQNYKIIESSIVTILKYYNLVNNSNFNTCRHKYFFSENKKLIKTKYFTEDTIQKINESITDIYKKI